MTDRKRKKRKWRRLRRDGPPGVRWWIAIVTRDGDDLFPFRDGEARALVFLSEQAATDAAEWIMNQNGPEARKTIKAAGYDPELVVVTMGQEKWDLFRREVPYVECRTLDDVKKACKGLRQVFRELFTDPEMN